MQPKLINFLSRLNEDELFVNMMMSESGRIQKFHVSKLFLCLGTVQFLDLLYRSNFIKENDIIELLGPPSTYSLGDIDTLIYIERLTSSSKLTKLGGKKLLTNNVLVVEINNRGLAVNKSFLDSLFDLTIPSIA